MAIPEAMCIEVYKTKENAKTLCSSTKVSRKFVCFLEPTKAVFDLGECCLTWSIQLLNRWVLTK